MAPAKQLYEFQVLETGLAQSQKALAQVRAGLQDSQALDDARRRLDQARKSLEAVQAEQRDLELGLGTLESHIQQVEKKLYDGSISNPKELQGYQQDLRMLRRQKSEQEDALLEVMDRAEGANGGARAAQSALASAEAAWNAQHQQLIGERDRLTTNVARLEQQLQAAVSSVDPRELKLYESMKRSRGTAVSRVEQGICRACGLTLPSHELQRARAAVDLVRCSSCGRLLFVV